MGYEDIDIENCSVQPMNKSVLQALPEGYRTVARYQFWTSTPLISLEQGTTKLSDQIFVSGEWLSAYNIDSWEGRDFLTHYHCVAVREDINNDPAQAAGGGNFG